MKSGTFTDSRDNHLYKWVKIGTQIWMAENVAFKPSSGALCYGNMLFNCDYYGTLYTYEVAKAACPEGWSLPSDKQWGQLEQYLGIDLYEVTRAGRRGSDQAISLKSNFGWVANGNGPDRYGFAVLPSGSFIKFFNRLGSAAFFWTSTRQKKYLIVPKSWTRSFTNLDGKIGRYIMSQSSYQSVRCIKDN